MKTAFKITSAVIFLTFFGINLLAQNKDCGISARKSGNNIIIEYSIRSGWEYSNVRLFMSTDNGENFEGVPMSCILGDIGEDVNASLPIITFYVLKYTDGESFNYDNVVFKITIYYRTMSKSDYDNRSGVVGYGTENDECKTASKSFHIEKTY